MHVGLEEEREKSLLLQLQEQATALVGEPAVCALIETLLDLLTEANHPLGDCLVCLEPLQHTETGPVRLPCFHCMHG